MNDLVVITADVDIEASVRTILERTHSLGIRQLSTEFLRHPGHDPGVFSSGAELARNSAATASNALLVLDMAWDGNPHTDPADLEADLEAQLHPIWDDRAKVIAIQPEVEVWAWSRSPHVATQLGWDSADDLKLFLETGGHWPANAAKPPDPKAALEAAARQQRTILSSAVFRAILTRVSLANCSDTAFHRLRDWLRIRFPA
jgi:hypothetical protein